MEIVQFEQALNNIKDCINTLDRSYKTTFSFPMSQFCTEMHSDIKEIILRQNLDIDETFESLIDSLV